MNAYRNNNRVRHAPRKAAVLVGMALTMLPAGSALALEDFGSPSFNWNNTFRYGLLYRLQDQDAALIANPNLDDGNRNFDQGVVSNRLELLSELDMVYENGFGARVSGLGWFDTVYNRDNDHPGATANHSSKPFNEFTDRTRELHGRDLELRDAFVFGRLNIGDSPLRFRAGQYSLVWGESLFFANNAIAGGQNAFDIDRLLADPTAEAKEFVLPVPQVSAELQLSPDVTLGAYYQLGYEPNRLPAVGSYFSTTDTAVDGAESILLGPTRAPLTDIREPDDHGQYGVKLSWRLDDVDLGFYALRFHDKAFQQVVRLGAGPGGVAPESYYLTYHQGTTAYGISASRSFGSVNVALEGSIRQDQALASSHAADASGLAPPGVITPSDNDDNPAYAVGDTAHLNLSTIWLLEPGPLWQEANFVGELAWNRLLSCEQNCDTALDPNATRDAVSLRAVFEPTYRQVFPGLDLGVPVGIGYTPKGSRSSVGPGYPADNGGDITLGLSGVYLGTWQVNLAYTNFFGKTGAFLDDSQSFSYQQSLKDRDFLSLSVRRSF